MKNVFVTGATGLVGSNLCEYLVNKGCNVKALVRINSDKRFLDSLKNVEYIYADLEEKDKINEAMKGVDTVFHCAAQVGLLTTYDHDYAKTNVQGTRHILEACLNNKVAKLVYVSTLGVLGILKDHYGDKEDSPYVKTGNPYFDTKIDAERIVMNYYRDKNLPVTVIRPGFLVGERDRNNLPHIMPYLLRNQMSYIGHGNNDISLTSVRNLIQAMILAAENDNASGQIYNITDGSGISSKQFIKELCSIMNMSEPKVHIPLQLATKLARTVEDFSRFFERDTSINEYTIALIGNSHNFDISKAINELGYNPNDNYEEELKKSVDWYLENYNKVVRRAKTYAKAKKVGVVGAALTMAGLIYFSKRKKTEVIS